jgi:hypothetical protein
VDRPTPLTSAMTTDRPDREWVPTSFFLATGDDYATEFAFSPRQIMHNAGLRYVSQITVYDPTSGRPCHRVSSQPIGLQDCFRTSSTALQPHLPRDVEFFYCEAFNTADAPPADANVALSSNLHYFSKSGKLQGDLASNYIFGAPRKAFKGKLYYDHFPLGRGFPGMALKVFLMNPYVRPSDFQIYFTSLARRNRFVTDGQVTGKAVGTVEFDIPVSKARDSGFAVVVATELKLNVMYGTLMKASGVMCGLDHGHPFLMQLLSH